LETAEEAMLTLYCDRGQFSDGQSVLELGCGWGSLTLFMAKKYPNSSFTAVSNSHSQKKYIDAEAKKLGLTNIQMITADINGLTLDQRYDRIVSIEMFEHIRNYDLLFRQLSDWLNDDGLCFIHVFGHARYPYTFDVDATRKKASSWTARNFFTGGQMPSKDLFSNFDTHLHITQTWEVDGRHYEKTSRAWLENLIRHKDQVIRLFDSSAPGKGKEIFTQWRVFYLAIAELFGFRNGTEWQVYHYLLKKRVSSSVSK
jgi:cyclopropane-fatty-acyl-phospholipid synthase